MCVVVNSAKGARSNCKWRETGKQNAIQFRKFGKTQRKEINAQKNVITGKGIKNCWISTLSTDNLIFYYDQRNKL